MADTRPNIVFLFTDQHAAAFTGCYGDDTSVTPNIDKLAGSGAIFENTYCPSPLCVPSRMAMMTTQYPHDIGVYTNRDYLRADTPTFVHALGCAGYHTSLIGRMHFLGPDQLHGFQVRRVGDISVNWPGSPLIDYGNLNAARGTKGSTLRYAGVGETIIHHYDRAVTHGALDYIDELAKRSDDQPFFMTVGWYGPHPPFIALEEDYKHFEGHVPPPRLSPPPSNLEHPYLNSWRKRAEFDNISNDDITRARTAYYANLRMIDRQVGKVVDALVKAGLTDNTIIVYSSDHGEQLGERGFWQKNTFYDHSVKVPLIWCWPEQVTPGQRRREIVNLIDLAASFVDVANGEALPNGRGRSFINQLTGESCAWHDLTMSEFYGGLVSINTGGIANRLVRSDRYKFIYYHGFPEQLFDMREDPLEQTDLILDPTRQDVVRHMRQLVLQDWSPQQILKQIDSKTKDIEVLRNWTRAVDPSENYRWSMEEKILL